MVYGLFGDYLMLFAFVRRSNADFCVCLLVCKFCFEFEAWAFAYEAYHCEVVAVEGIFEAHARAEFYLGLELDFKRF